MPQEVTSSHAGQIVKVSGPLVVADGMTGSRMYDVVKVSDRRLIGEVIRLDGSRASIQVYEETGGIGPGEPVYPTHEPLSVELGPGLIESIYDGIQRPLDAIRRTTGDFLDRGVETPGLDRARRWPFAPARKPGDLVGPGDTIGTVQETPLIQHRIMIPPGVAGRIKTIEQGEFAVTDTVCVLLPSDPTRVGQRPASAESAAPLAPSASSPPEIPLTMLQRWPVRKPRPVRRKLPPDEPLVTGQRVIDTFFPIAKGGTACVPGPFGSGKTVIQHQLAKWSDAQVIVFVGCGERGNEMTDVLLEFPQLKDPRSGYPLMKRTVLIANTSNMPVAAREASVYTGITIAEYYRDMGYSVALQADSTSRWAEAMREISGRLEEMPGEEGYPAYLATRIAEFYERAGKVICLGDPATPGPEAGPARPETQGALTVIGAVSPPGGDLNDPVVQATLRVVKVFWSLEDRLAFRRHFPAISWLNSYSLYSGALAGALGRGASAEFVENAGRAMALLEREAELEEIVRLVGKDTLSAPERLVLEVARSIREDYLHQNAFHETDTYASLPKQAGMLRAILAYDTLARQALQRGADIGYLERVPAREQVARLRYLTEADAPAATAAVESELTEQLSQPSAGPNPAADSTKTNLGPARAEQEAG